jgi:hypothetical protein
MSRKKPIEAIAYLRTSSTTNVGPDKDSERRQREAIKGFARRSGYELVAEFYDPAVSGADPIDTRPGVQRLAAATALAKRLHRASPKTGERLSLRRISMRLADAGHLNERGEPYHPQSINNMLDG